jgi:D-lyxose ketol-isomerase
MKKFIVLITCALMCAACCQKEKSSAKGCCQKEKTSAGDCCKKKKTAGEGCCQKEKASNEGCCKKGTLTFDNADFYTADGKFNEEAGKDAILRLMKYYKYPVTDKTRSQLWVSDYGTGRFTEVGLAAIMYANDTKDRYMLQDMFLLPNQMLPEHWHEKPENDLPAKMEGWLVRNGMSYIVGEGEDNLASFPEIKIPASHTGGVTVKNAVKTLPGEFVPLAKVFSHHWQIAGPQGAIITEVANVHDGDAVRHQVKEINNHFLGK